MIQKNETDVRYKNRLTTLLQFISEGGELIEGFKYLLPPVVKVPLQGKKMVPKITVLLSELSTYFNEQLNCIGIIRKRMMYPVLLLGVTIGLFGVFLWTFLPMVESFLGQMNNGSVPIILTVLSEFKGFVLRYSKQIVLLVLSILLLVRKKLKRYIWGWFLGSQSGDQLWMVGMLLSAGVSIKEAVEEVEDENNEKWSEFKTKFFQVGVFSRVWVNHYPISKYHAAILEGSEFAPTFKETLIILAKDIRAERIKTQIRVVIGVQAVVFFILALSIAGLLFLIYMPLLHTIQTLPI